MRIPFDNRYATLGEGFFEKIRPTPVKNWAMAVPPSARCCVNVYSRVR